MSELQPRICHIQGDPTKVDSIRSTFVSEAAEFMRKALGDVAEANVAELFVMDLRSQGRLQRKLLEPAVSVSMAYPNAVKLVSDPVLCRKRLRAQRDMNFGRQRKTCMLATHAGSNFQCTCT